MTRLTDQIAKKALPPVRGQAMFWDDEIKGFGLRVTPGGAKSFVLDYRADARQRRITIGAYPDWTVAAARDAAKTLKRDIDLGNDPMGNRRDERNAPTMAELWERYEREHLIQKSPRAQSDEKSMWKNIILPRFGKMKLASITSSEIDSLHHDITTIRKTPGRPSSMHIIEAEFQRRKESGSVAESLNSESAQLEAWFKKQYPDKPPVTAKTIANRLRDHFREYQKKSA